MDPIRRYYLDQVARIAKGKELKSAEFSQASGLKEAIEFTECEFASRIDWFTDFRRLFEAGKNLGLIDNILVHGSFGDRRFNSYSDLDATLVLSDSLANDPWRWQSLSRWHNKEFFPFLTKVDPLQHHGAFYLWRDLQDNYSESILPLDVYRKGNSWAAAPTTLSFTCHHPQTEGGLALGTLNSLVNADKTFFRYGYSLFQAKRFLSNLMLVPALYYTDLGQFGSKRKSFEPFYEEFGDAAKVIRDASAIRSNWPNTGSFHTKIAQASAGNYQLFRSVQNFFGSGMKTEMRRMRQECATLLIAVKERQQ